MCRKHGWDSEFCPHCLYERDPQLYTGRALRNAMQIIQATSGQKHILINVYKADGIKAALRLARQWQNPSWQERGEK